MNRKTFLSTVAAIICAPFALKSKEKPEVTITDSDREWVKANPALWARSTATGWEVPVTFKPYRLTAKNFRPSKE
jgi:restriction endonuclease Mrr